MRALLLLITICLVGQSVATRRVPLVIPAAMQHLELETLVLCRDARGAWDGDGAWRVLEPARSAVPVRNGCRVLLRRAGDAIYLASATIHGVSTLHDVPFLPMWMRTARAAPASSQPYWVSEDSPGAECTRTAAGSLCMFVLADDPGVLVTLDETGLRFALSGAGGSHDAAVWRAAPWGRFVRVRAPRARAWSARVSVLEPALKHGRDLLRQSRVSTAAVVHRLGDAALWVEGVEKSEANPRLEIAGAGAATTSVDLSRVRGSPLTIAEIVLPPEEVIEGEVRSEGRMLSGAAVSLMRFLEPSGGPETPETPETPESDDERFMERVGETKTDATGRFRLDRLARGEYELTVSHPRRGRTRMVVRAPSIHRLALKPHALVRGRVISSGVPVTGATVTVLPSYDAILAARNPAMLLGESVQTAADGRFEIVTPDNGRLTLTVLRDGAAARIELGDAQALPSTLDLGDVSLDEPLEVVILLELPATCQLSAAGPIGQPGIMLRKAEPAGASRWILRSALEGRWLVEASCGGADVALEPSVIDISRRNRELVRLAPRREPG